MIRLGLDQLLARFANFIVNQVGSGGAHSSHAQLLVQIALFCVVGVQLILNACPFVGQHGNSLRVSRIALACRFLYHACCHRIRNLRRHRAAFSLGGNRNLVAGGHARNFDGVAKPIGSRLFALAGLLPCAGPKFVECIDQHIGICCVLHLLLNKGVVGCGIDGFVVRIALRNHLGLRRLDIDLALRHVNGPRLHNVGKGQNQSNSRDPQCKVTMQFKRAHQVQAQQRPVIAACRIRIVHGRSCACSSIAGMNLRKAVGLNSLQTHSAPA